MRTKKKTTPPSPRTSKAKTKRVKSRSKSPAAKRRGAAERLPAPETAASHGAVETTSAAPKSRTRGDHSAAQASGPPAKLRTRSDSPTAADKPSARSGIQANVEKSGRRRARTARDWSQRSSPVVEILDDSYPIGALRRFLDSIKGRATDQQTQIALSAAQLLLLPIARESRGGVEVKELVDLILERWADWGEARSGFHGQEFLRNALAAVGVDRKRIARLEAHVPPEASAELLFAVAAAFAVARDKVAMLRTTEAALSAGASPSDFRRDANFAPYANDPDLAERLTRADQPAIEVDIDPHVAPVRSALESLVGLLKELGAEVELRPPVRPSTILEAERVARLSLPNDYRALLTITNGMRLWDREFLGIADYRDYTQLTARAHQFLHADYAVPGVSDCVPLANWGHPNDWLLYDPRRRLRSDRPGYVAVLGADQVALNDLVAALDWLTEAARDVLRTN